MILSQTSPVSHLWIGVPTYPIIHFSKFENLFTFLNERYLFKQSILLSSINEVDNAGPEEISLSSTCEYYF